MRFRAPRWIRRFFGPWPAFDRLAARPWYPRFHDAVFVALIALLGVAAGLVLVEPWRASDRPLEEIRVGGIAFAPGDPRPEALVRLARSRLQAEVTLVGPGIESRTTWAALGAEVDIDSLSRILVGAAGAGSALVRYNRAEAPKPGTAILPLPVSLVSGAAVESLIAVKEMIDRKPRNARFDFAAERVVPEEEGRALDVYATLERLDRALAEGAPRVEMAVTVVKAKVLRADLEGIEVGEVAGFYETPYSRQKKDEDRTHNVKLGASLLDGQVLLPGKTFSFNDIVGDRTEARGFRFAPVIAGGALVEGMGGGTCQVASTLHSAAFFGGLVIEGRQPHSRPSGYIKMGLDATVVYPSVDLKLRNPFAYPIVIHYTVEGGIARAEFRAVERPFTVTLLRKVIGTVPFQVRTIDDPHLARGREVVTQLGVPGYTVRRYKIIERDKVAYRFPSVDTYPPTVQFIHRGTGDPAAVKNDPEAPKPDPHNPYRASDSLRMVQGPNGLWYESSHD
jgi:vancomycin resistance protein YoaR